MGVSMHFVALMGVHLDEQKADELMEFAEDNNLDYTERAFVFDEKSGLVLIFDGMNGRHSYLGKIIYKSNDLRFEGWPEFYEEVEWKRLQKLRSDMEKAIQKVDSDITSPVKLHLFTEYW